MDLELVLLSNCSFAGNSGSLMDETCVFFLVVDARDPIKHQEIPSTSISGAVELNCKARCLASVT